MLAAGDRAPAFDLPDLSGRRHRLGEALDHSPDMRGAAFGIELLPILESADAEGQRIRAARSSRDFFVEALREVRLVGEASFFVEKSTPLSPTGRSVSPNHRCAFPGKVGRSGESEKDWGVSFLRSAASIAHIYLSPSARIIGGAVFRA